VAAQAAAVEEQLVEVDEVHAAELEEAEEDAAATTGEAAAARDRIARPDA
jgi:hypothetical protein